MIDDISVFYLVSSNITTPNDVIRFFIDNVNIDTIIENDIEQLLMCYNITVEIVDYI
ncbi:MAG: hypothetical protein Faunusvirus17_14, partial [Faunusvirus sp.]